MINLRCREEKALEAVKELQEKLEDSWEGMKDLETELLVIRKNYGDILDKNE